ncbi:translation protein [Cladochytrium replicatum]|nr:translation protein [Cladochytrium replicatum]
MIQQMADAAAATMRNARGFLCSLAIARTQSLRKSAVAFPVHTSRRMLATAIPPHIYTPVIPARPPRSFARIGGLRRPAHPPPVPAARTWTPNSLRCGLLGIKRGMTAVWDEWGVLTPVTVIQIVDNQVLKTRWDYQVGSYMVEVGAIRVRPGACRRQQLFHYRRVGVAPRRILAEFRVSADAVLPTGVVLNAAHFVPGQYVDCTSKSVGKGFQGGMKKWGFKGQPASHGVSLAHRSIGSTGHRKTPARVFPGKKMPGRMGGKLRTVQSLKVMKVDPHNNLIFVKGGVPGKENSPVRIVDAVKKWLRKEAFPVWAQKGDNGGVPFPTFVGDPKSLSRELLPAPEMGTMRKGAGGEQEVVRDPFSRARREKEFGA